MPFLGIHLTPRFNQNAIVGPNAYFFNEIDKKDIEDIKFIFSKFGINLILLTNKNSYRNHVFKELTLNLRNKFLNSCNQFLEKYFIEKSDYHTMNFSLFQFLRPQLISRGNLKFVNDFLYYKRKKCIHLINAVSPAFTSSFALAKYLSKYIK